MNSKTEDYFSKRIHRDWIPILEPVLPELYVTLASIFNTYPKKDNKKYRCKEDGTRLFPKPNDVLRAFRSIKPSDVKVIIVGQDPYFIEGFATGIAFAVPAGQDIPPSLQVIFEEIKRTRDKQYSDIIDAATSTRKLLGMPPKDAEFLRDICMQEVQMDRTLSYWIKKGVLFLNASLTVEENKANSHKHVWETLVLKIVECIHSHNSKIVISAFGQAATSMVATLVGKAYICSTYHPAYDSRTRKEYFVGSGIFQKINKTLREAGIEEIDW